MGNDDGGRGRAGRFAAYLDGLVSVLGDPRRSAAMISYCTGLLLPSERKSVEPMAALTPPTRTAAQPQSLSEISALALKHVAGVKTTTTVWAPDIFSQPDTVGRGRTAQEDASASLAQQD
jgi:hypothetical protein